LVVETLISGVGTGDSGGSTNRGPELLGPEQWGYRKVSGKNNRKIIKIVATG